MRAGPGGSVVIAPKFFIKAVYRHIGGAENLPSNLRMENFTTAEGKNAYNDAEFVWAICRPDAGPNAHIPAAEMLTGRYIHRERPEKGMPWWDVVAGIPEMTPDRSRTYKTLRNTHSDPVVEALGRQATLDKLAQSNRTRGLRSKASGIIPEYFLVHEHESPERIDDIKSIDEIGSPYHIMVAETGLLPAPGRAPNQMFWKLLEIDEASLRAWRERLGILGRDPDDIIKEISEIREGFRVKVKVPGGSRSTECKLMADDREAADAIISDLEVRFPGIDIQIMKSSKKWLEKWT